MSPVFILGCGYVGERLAHQYRALGCRVTGVVRTEAGVARLRRLGLEAVRCDLATDDPGTLGLADSRVFHLAPPPDQGRLDPATRRLIDAFERGGHPSRLVYIGTTGVYGDCGGEWIDETHPTRPVAERSLRRLDAEDSLRRWSQASGRDLVILRVAGIYGPERLPLERIRAGTPMVRREDAPYTNRIHVDDLVAVCMAAMERGTSQAVYNACDGHPSTMTDYFLQVAAAAGLPAPPLIDRSEARGRLSEGMLSYLSESRRLRNARLHDELGVVLRYPTLDDGLQAIFGTTPGP